MAKAALKGNVQAFAALTDRIEGKVTNKVEMGGPGGGAIPVVSYSPPEENETALAALLARHGLKAVPMNKTGRFRSTVKRAYGFFAGCFV
jgi:hypothetical protein